MNSPQEGHVVLRLDRVWPDVPDGLRRGARCLLPLGLLLLGYPHEDAVGGAQRDAHLARPHPQPRHRRGVVPREGHDLKNVKQDRNDFDYFQSQFIR